MLQVEVGGGVVMEGVQLQLILAVGMFITTAIAGLFPMKLLRILDKGKGLSGRRTSWALTLLSCFAGGVFLATCFLDIFPHVNGNYAKYRRTYGWSNGYPLPEFMACLGFFLVYFVEELSLKVFASSSAQLHGHSHGGAPPPRAGFDPMVIAVEEALKRADDDGDAKPRTGSCAAADSRAAVADTHGMVINESVRYMSESNETSFLKSLTFAFAMSLHSILEGFALGVQSGDRLFARFQEEKAGIRTLFLSLIIHKGIEAFSVGLQVSRPNAQRKCLVLSTILAYALMTPVGSMLGVLLTKADMNAQSRDLAIILLEGCAAGTFIYVTFFEVLAQERANDHSNLVQLGAIVTGFFVISALQAHEHFGNT